MRTIKSCYRQFLFFPILFIAGFLKAQTPAPESQALKTLIESRELKSAHVGVYVYDDSAKKEIANYQSDKYFVPASNTKLVTLYAGMKYLGDSLIGIMYFETDTALFVFPTGDPSLLHPDFATQPVIDFLKKTRKKIYIVNFHWQEKPLGEGWAWDDYNEDYSIERSQMPVYGNFIRWNQQKSLTRSNPAFEPTSTVSTSPEIPWKVRFSNDTSLKNFSVQRLMDSNVFIIHLSSEPNVIIDVPFITANLNTTAELLPDTIGRQVHILNWNTNPPRGLYDRYPAFMIKSRPVDSIYMPMMYRSDNFYAEQVLIMAGNQHLGLMKDQPIIDTLLAGALSGFPQKPNWVDGSGLSHFNLFSPQDFVYLLTKFKNEFGMERMKRVLPTGGKGTLKNYYKADSGYVFAKTGSLNAVICLSGYIYTYKKRLLEFSILVNNYMGSGTAVRRQVESYVEYLRKNN